MSSAPQPQFTSDIAEMQHRMGVWWTKNFGHNAKDVPAMSLLALNEEVGELCRAHLKQEQGIRGSKEQWDQEIEKECGDVFVTLAVYAYRKGVDLEKAIKSRWDVVERRDWITNPTTGGKEKEDKSL